MIPLDLNPVLTALSHHTFALSIALLVILLLRRLAARFLHPHWRYALWLALPLAFLSLYLPKQASIVPVQTVAVLEAYTPVRNVQPFAQQHAVVVGFAPVVSLLWGLGVVVSLVFLARSYRRAYRQARNGVTTPCLVGVFAPKLMLPANFSESFSDAQRGLIIAHELFHLRRRDPLLNLIARLLHCLFWFHPLMPMAMRAFRDDQEMSCDAAIIASQAEYAACYAQALTLCAAVDAEPSELWCQWRPVHPLLERITMLKQLKHNHFRHTLSASLLSTALLGVSWLSFASAPAADRQHYWVALQVQRDDSDLATVALRISDTQPGSVEIGQDSELSDGRTVLRPELRFQIQASSDGGRTHLDIQSVWQSKQTSSQFVEHSSLSLAIEEQGEIQLIHPETNERLRVKLASRPAAATEPAHSLPAYPKAAWLLGISGKVMVNVSVDAKGVVQSAEVASAQPAGVFEQSALAAARAKHYPAQSLAVGADVRWLQVPIQFRLGK